MQDHSERFPPIDIKERRELAQLFCLALRNVQAYGIEHTVSATTLHTFYNRTVDLLDRYAEIVWSHAEGKVLLNGEPCELRTADDVLAQRMYACSLETFVFLDSMSRVELNRFVAWLATGVDSLQPGESYVGIRIDESVYARISRDEKEPGGSHKSGKTRDAGSQAGIKQFDLDSMLDDVDESGRGGASKTVRSRGDLKQHLQRFLEQQRLVEKQRKAILQDMQEELADPDTSDDIRNDFLAMGGSPDEWEYLCWQSQHHRAPKDGSTLSRDAQIHKMQKDLDALQKRCAMGHIDSDAVAQELEKLRGSFEGLIQTIFVQADSLVEKVHADRMQIAKLEEAARESGAPIHLSREELLESLAEINQELAQPLTVSTALVELLSSGRLGEVDEKQRKVFDLASSSLQRLEMVVKYLQKLSGAPVKLSPNKTLLDEVYGDSGAGK